MATTEIDALWNFGDPAASEARFRLARASANAEDWQELTTQIARAEGLQGRYPEAHATLDSITDQVHGRQRVRYLLERGRLLNSAGSPEEAVPLFLAAVAAAESCGEIALEVDALHMLGIAAPEDEQEGWTLSAIKRAEDSGDPAAQQWLGSLLNNLGWIFHDRKRYDKALECFEHALAWHTTNGTTESIQVARWSVGRALRSCGQLERALAVQESLAAERITEQPDGYVFEEIAECLLEMGNRSRAREMFAKAFETLSGDPWLVSNEPERVARLKRLSVDQE